MRRFIIGLLFIISFCANAQQQFTVYFDTNIDVPQPNSISKIVNWTQQNPEAVVTAIEGYADYRGTDGYNQALSERRANAVLKLLKENGALLLDSIPVTAKGEVEGKRSLGKNRKAVIYYSDAKIRPDKSGETLKLSEFTQKVRKAKVGEVIIIPNLNFYNNSDIVLPASLPVLNELLQIMRDNPKMVIDIQGHICCQPVDENQVSLLRAVAVYKFLTRNGIAAQRLHYISYSSTKPIYPLPEKTEEERMANRRVEIKILKR
ncbi:OmpA family protein [Flavobacterium sp. RHBU_24]|uniref:OmpA family protein n=1 Tax=Flavobacterium sp. RHBU_24 TaxID=3391185 RepID=UPI0039855C9D